MRVREGAFRADLLHRLNVVRLPLPPLRERREDIPLLAERFMRAAAGKFDAAPRRFGQAAMARLMAHDWPGNVRELENVCWRMAALAPADVITATDLDGALQPAPVDGDGWEAALGRWTREQLAAGNAEIHAVARERFDRVLLDAALEHTGGRRTEAATRLGLGRNTVTRKLGTSRKRR